MHNATVFIWVCLFLSYSKAEQRKRTFEKRELRRVFRAKRDEATQD
jgi:hypothetical protein